MDNRINENRKKIRLLRTQMLEAEAAIRAQIGRDEDCTETSLVLMAMRAEMSALSKERGRLGDDREPILVEQLMHPRRAPATRLILPAKRHRASKNSQAELGAIDDALTCSA
ncbi:MAG: hypothetical protein KGK01_13540 [Bradyrhizobium sp.]|uniref:hypothetical protein n=1 Tax=Bradyrhizobium sp. TaxID=376 RepID=UPI001C296D61|nr:hypothetical protein [Bradyrhizobium sp.]MBU6463007.1 hypothetical protein [Pseudomonadota bacterium]MDE2066756.1 hypothetical protein [Bradyrhizobium sp.]MDE2243407.1 hypothetical protein [Bradyrhizobium sp.]MDE2467815.1 hypothetical protein [Bradyrhizobium sp.]